MSILKSELFLQSFSIVELEKRYSSELDPKTKMRLHCAILRKKGMNLSSIADIVGKSHSTVSDILNRFEMRGIDGCYAIKQMGRPKRIEGERMDTANHLLFNSPIKFGLPFTHWTTNLIIYYVEKNYPRRYSPRFTSSFFKSMGFTTQRMDDCMLERNKLLLSEYNGHIDRELKSLLKIDKRTFYWIPPSENQ